jgi:TRAP-type C4-dicarboxylate transport system substrate-binding protein
VHSDRDGVAALRDGRSDLAPCYSGWDRQAYPLAQALQLPGLFPSSELATTIAEELYSKYFRADVERQGILMGRLKATGAFHLFSVEPIRSLAQLKGLRVGTSEGVDREVFHLLGAIPVSMSSLETRQALASGRIDAMHLPDGPAEVFGINEIARYRTAFGLLRHNVEFGMSAEFWRALPLDLKRVLNAWLRAEAQAETQIFYGLAGAEARERFRAAGMQFLTLSEEDMTACAERLRPITDSFVESEEQQGRPARALIDDITVLKRKYAGKSAADLMREAIENPIETINPIGN